MTDTLHLTARTLKCTLVLDPAALAALPDPTTTRVVLTIKVAEGARTVTADIAAKSFRKAQAVIKEHGADNVALILQGKLAAGDVIVEAGLVAQVKVPKLDLSQTPAAPSPTLAAAAPVPSGTPRDGLADLRAAAARRAP